MKWQEVQTHWDDIEERVHAHWGRLTDSDLREIDGERSELVSRLQQRYKLDRKQAEKEAEEFIMTLGN